MGIFYVQKPPIGTQGKMKSVTQFLGGQMNKTIFFFEPIGLSRPKLNKISLIFNKIQVYHSEILIKIFDNLDIDYQMLINLGYHEPFYKP